MTATRLNGTTVEGELNDYALQQVVMATSNGNVPIPFDDLLMLQWNRPASSSKAENTASVTLVDGSRLTLTGFQVEGDTAILTSPLFSEPLKIPRTQILHVQLGSLDDALRQSWDDLITRNTRDDLLVFRKENVLDYVGGVVGQIDSEKVTLVVRGKELTTPRDRVFGVIYTGRTPPKDKLAAEVGLIGGDRWQVAQLSRQEGIWQATLRCGIKLQAPGDQVALIDFGGGRLRYLSDLPYDDRNSTDPNPQFPGGSVVWFVSNDSPVGLGLSGLPLKIGSEEFRRGVWLHSGAVVRYRLNREYRRLQTTAGFELSDADRMPKYDPHVKLVVEGDGRELYARELTWQDAPETLDLDLTDVRELTVRVISRGEYKGILERVALGNARLIK